MALQASSAYPRVRIPDLNTRVGPPDSPKREQDLKYMLGGLKEIGFVRFRVCYLESESIEYKDEY
jgi:hypothetical protein